MNPPSYPQFELTPWVDHIYASLRFLEATIREHHDLLEHDEVNDELRASMSKAIAWINTARDEAFRALEKMGYPMGDEARSRAGRSAIAEETKAKVLELNAAYLEQVLADPRAGESYAQLIMILRDAIHAMKTEAAATAARVQKDLGGPSR